MKQGTVEQAASLLADSGIFNVRRSPSKRSDFGDPATVGLNLRRIGLSFDQPKEFPPDHSFGVYCGQHGKEWVVVTKKFDYSGLSGCEIFESLDALQRRWELD